MFASGQPDSGKFYQCIRELGDNVEKLISELHTDLLKAEQENKDLREELAQSEARNRELAKELGQNENQKNVVNQEPENSEAQNKEPKTVVLEQQKTLLSYEFQLKHARKDLARSEGQIEDLKEELDQVASNASTTVQQIESRIDVMTKEHESLNREYNQALEERDVALVKLNTIGAELKGAKKDLESGKNVLETERISLAEKLTKAKEGWYAEKIALADRLTKAKEA
ncbi:uncharacterized protein LOC126788302 [Argentina anserina]|uniref:uncharacterized protein LOC126788302 n=1 Tax=Argentina anserina TaxID=57926 RepID=UPI0021767ABA|nr:uncharacterized protein LOC126788302 [Potentilla anserina]